jgi:hypothetical protein
MKSLNDLMKFNGGNTYLFRDFNNLVLLSWKELVERRIEETDDHWLAFDCFED